jgi:acyl carrier protein
VNAARPSTQARVLATVIRIAGSSRTPPDAGPETSLADGGFALDSVDMLELIVSCEQEFGIELDPKALLAADALRSAGGLAQVVQSALEA